MCVRCVSVGDGGGGNGCTAEQATQRSAEAGGYFDQLFCSSQLIQEVLGCSLYRLVLKKDTVLLRTSLVWPAVAGCSRAETFSQLSAISFAQPCTCMCCHCACTLVALEELALEARLLKYSGVYIYR